mmetsp:Transcript_69965/g.167949  ORF Transcript_69965/g.167949 Transcript_69965/m.167949 type:complete len:225 (-) Transcript_69965:116-790(-)
MELTRSPQALVEWRERTQKHELETRESWRRAWARSCKADRDKQEDYTFTRWLSPTNKAGQMSGFEQHHGVGNAWQRTAWQGEARSRWREQNPPNQWRSMTEQVPQSGEATGAADGNLQSSSSEAKDGLHVQIAGGNSDLTDVSDDDVDYPTGDESEGADGAAESKPKSKADNRRRNSRGSAQGDDSIKKRTLTITEAKKVSHLLEESNDHSELRLLREVTSIMH